MSRISGLADGTLKVARGELGYALEDEEVFLGYEVSHPEDLYVYRFGVLRNGISSQKSFIEFASSELHEDLFSALAKIVKRFGLNDFRVVYLSPRDTDLSGFIDGLDSHDEVGAFTLLLEINDEGSLATSSERRDLASAHVAKWEGRRLNEVQRQQYFSPALDRWELDTFKSLHSCRAGRAEVLTRCGDREFRKLYNFLSTFSERGVQVSEESLTLREVLEQVPDRDNYFLESRSASNSLPIHYEEYRNFALNLTLPELEYLNCAMNANTLGQLSPAGVIRVSNLYLSCSRARSAEWWPVSPATSEFFSTAPEVEEELFEDKRVSRLVFQEFAVSDTFVNFCRELVEKDGKTIGQVRDAVFGHYVSDPVPAEENFYKIYILERLVEEIKSAKTVFDIFAAVLKSDRAVSLRAWEEYSENWESFKGMDPVMTLQILDGGH